MQIPLALCKDPRGTTILEFAIIAPIFFLIIMAVLQFGIITFNQVLLENATSQSGRTSANIARTGNDVVAMTTSLIQQKTNGLIGGGSVVISANLVSAGGAALEPDICQTNPVSTPATCLTTFIDSNGNGTYDAPGALTLGAEGDLVEIRVSYPLVALPMMKGIIGNDGVLILSSSTVVRNAP